jgi:tetratricopeptide (TPR) repeat protein
VGLQSSDHRVGRSGVVVRLRLVRSGACDSAGPESSLLQKGASSAAVRQPGDHHYGISTRRAAGAAVLRPGLRLYYAFNHAEAIRAFDEAARLDPAARCATGARRWRYGPNINLPMDSAPGVAAYAAIQQAVARSGERRAAGAALIDALAARYAAAAGRPGGARLGVRRAMERSPAVSRRPGGGDALRRGADGPEPVAVLEPGRLAAAGTRRAARAAGAGARRNPDHPGANHFYIHAVEAVDPERAVPMAERLAGLMPGAGHLVHMPGHIYIRVGRYLDAIRANEHAVHADETYIRDHTRHRHLHGGLLPAQLRLPGLRREHDRAQRAGDRRGETGWPR